MRILHKPSSYRIKHERKRSPMRTREFTYTRMQWHRHCCSFTKAYACDSNMHLGRVSSWKCPIWCFQELSIKSRRGECVVTQAKSVKGFYNHVGGETVTSPLDRPILNVS